MMTKAKWASGQWHECPRCYQDHDEPYSYCGACREYMAARQAIYRKTPRGREVGLRNTKKWLRAHPDKHNEANRRYYGFVPENKPCAYCGEIFTTKRSDQRFCCRAHSIAFNNAKQAGRPRK